MFDLITGKTPHMPGGGRAAALASGALHTGLIGAIVTLPLLYVTHTLPQVPTMMAFVAAIDAPPPPAPPPPPPALRSSDAAAKVVSGVNQNAPVAAPSRIEPEPAGLVERETGVVGGVEGGVPGGVSGGIVESVAPPPPPSPPPAPLAPARIGGEIKPPTLVRRVEPSYPELALKAHVEGTVILEAIIDEDGAVKSLKVLRSVPLLDQAALAAVEQWRYSPTILNGRPIRVILTVVLSFKIPLV